MRGDTCT